LGTGEKAPSPLQLLRQAPQEIRDRLGAYIRLPMLHGGAKMSVHQGFFPLNPWFPPSLNSLPFRSDPLRKRSKNHQWKVKVKFVFKLQGCSTWGKSSVRPKG
jgi:hypothetical protein